jgi:hypothetical protein
MSTFVSLRADATAPTDPLAEELAAYNRAFVELELPWQWDAATFRELLACADGDCVGAYIERRQRHLLKSYDRRFLRDLVLAKKLGDAPASA